LPSEKLAVELDGAGHYTASGVEADRNRDRFLSQFDIRVVRFENKEVFKSLETVLENIKSHFNGE